MKTNFLYHLPDLSKRGTKLSPGPESVGSCFHDFFPRNYHFVGFFCARESSHNGLISFFKENYNSLPQVCSNSSSFTFWPSHFSSCARSNWTGIWTSIWTGIWTGNSDGTWTDKQSSHFSTAKEIRVKATFFFM